MAEPLGRPLQPSRIYPLVWDNGAAPKAIQSFKKLMWNLRTRRHRAGVLLDWQRRLYRLADVREVELALRNWGRAQS